MFTQVSDTTSSPRFCFAAIGVHITSTSSSCLFSVRSPLAHRLHVAHLVSTPLGTSIKVLTRRILTLTIFPSSRLWVVRRYPDLFPFSDPFLPPLLDRKGPFRVPVTDQVLRLRSAGPVAKVFGNFSRSSLALY